MNKKFWLAAIAVLAMGMIAVGCGDDDDDGDSSDEPSTEATAPESGGGDDSEGSESSGGTTADDVKAACEDVIAGTPAEAAGQASCDAAGDAFEQCATQAEDVPDENNARQIAIDACQDAADQTIAALEGAK